MKRSKTSLMARSPFREVIQKVQTLPQFMQPEQLLEISQSARKGPDFPGGISLLPKPVSAPDWLWRLPGSKQPSYCRQTPQTQRNWMLQILSQVFHCSEEPNFALHWLRRAILGSSSAGVFPAGLFCTDFIKPPNLHGIFAHLTWALCFSDWSGFNAFLSVIRRLNSFLIWGTLMSMTLCDISRKAGTEEGKVRSL